MLTLVAVVVAWLKGGHPERFGAVTTLVVFAVSFYTHELRVGAFYAGDAVVDFLMTGLFVWLALTSDRWWALVMSAIMTLTLLAMSLRSSSPISEPMLCCRPASAWDFWPR